MEEAVGLIILLVMDEDKGAADFERNKEREYGRAEVKQRLCFIVVDCPYLPVMEYSFRIANKG